ncbi:hypothetical protein F5883DRAFT_84019 [Diaporthe sp. PMI_573]|nr:hypothetical protein F5883DRAFT_84019 [Diaporthaceae sp. PMI_573]
MTWTVTQHNCSARWSVCASTWWCAHGRAVRWAVGNRCRSIGSISHVMGLWASGLPLRTSGARPAVSLGLSSYCLQLHACMLRGRGSSLVLCGSWGRSAEAQRTSRPIITEGLPGHWGLPRAYSLHVNDPVTLILQMYTIRTSASRMLQRDVLLS